MSEYLRIASAEQATTKTNQPFVKVHLADGSQLSCFDAALFGKILGQGAISATIDRSRPQYPKIVGVDSAPNGVPSSVPSSDAIVPTPKDVFIMRECALKCSVEAHGQYASPYDFDGYTASVRKLADSFLGWLEDPTPF